MLFHLCKGFNDPLRENKNTINILNEQKSKMDTKCKDFFNVKCLLGYENSNTINRIYDLKTLDRNNLE